ncbi:MAG: glycosyltransferase involved in cell wall biosynthesis [Crocinitomicaceae bacterium]|jgi:glycosyltransferase involved in cell wall biosynthesis
MAATKRILFLADINSVHTERWVKNLIHRGYEIGLFSLSEKKTTWIDSLSCEYHCVGVNQDKIRSKKRFSKLAYFSSFKELKSFTKNFNPEIVHAHYASSYGMLLMRLKFKNSVLSLWGSDVYEFPKRSFIHKKLFQRILNSAPIVCSTSKDMAREASLYVKKDFHITPFGIDTDRFKPTGANHPVFTIGTVKTLEKVYGIDRLIHLFDKFQSQFEGEVQLKIFGSGSELDSLQSLVKELKLESKVHFKGFVEDQNLIEAFNSLDVFVALSRRESFGVAALEAQSCGIPVIVSNVGGLPEVVSPETGFMVDGNPIAIGLVDGALEALNKLIDADFRKAMGAKGRSFVIDNYSESVCVDQLLKVYQ